jgi:hypothetical protein
MRLARFVVSVALASGLVVACADENPVTVPEGADGLFAGGPASPKDGAHEADAGSPSGDGGAGGDADTGARSWVDGSLNSPATGADGAAPAEPGDAAATGEPAAAQAEAGDAACACGCTDPCLTELIAACKAPTILLLPVCPKVPATCACETTCAEPPPAPPSLDACVAQFLLTGG